MDYKGRPRRLPTVLLAGSMLAGSYPTFAQEADVEDDIFELTPFEVVADEDQGYRASSSLAGTRLRTKLEDIGSAISVYTEELMEDVAAVDNQTLLAFGTNTEVGGARGNFVNANRDGLELSNLSSPNNNTRIRGLTQADSTRNYFLTDAPWDGYSINRVDVQRGANSILFGLGSPAGIINATTREAAFKDETKIQIKNDKFDSFRMTADFNKVLLEDQLAARFIVLDDSKKYRQKPAFEDDKRLFIASTYIPKFANGENITTKVKVSLETGSIEGNRPRFVAPIDGISQFFLAADETGFGAPWDTFEEISKFYGDPIRGGLGGEALDQITWNEVATSFNSTGTPYSPWIGRTLVGGRVLIYDSDKFLGAFESEVDSLGSYINVGTNDEPEIIVNNGFNNRGSLSSDIRRVAFFSTNTKARAAANIGLPFQGFWREESFTDTSNFDFFNHLIDGPNKLERKDWDVGEIDFAQTFFNNKLGYNLTFFKQSYEARQDAVLGSVFAPTIEADPGALSPAANPGNRVPNPFAGRAFVSFNLNHGGGNIAEIDRSSARFQGFARYDFNEKNDGLWARILGSHDVIGVAQTREKNLLARNYGPVGFAPDAHISRGDQFWPLGQLGPDATLQNYNSLNVSVSGTARFYLDASGPNLTGLQGLETINIVSGPINFSGFDPTPLPGFSPEDAAQRTFVDLWAMAPDATEPALALELRNPEQYVGWRENFATATLMKASDSEEALRFLTRSFRFEDETVDSVSGVWTGRFWDGAVVGMYGWREDEQVKFEDRFEFGNDPDNQFDTEQIVMPWSTEEDPDIRDVGPTWAHFDPTFPNARMAETTAQTRNWSIKANLSHISGMGDRLPFSVHALYSEGEVVTPAAERVDPFDNPLPNPSGVTEDLSLMLVGDGGKWSLRVTKYETAIQNARNGAIGNNDWRLVQTLEQGSRIAHQIENDLGNYTADWLPLSQAAREAGYGPVEEGGNGKGEAGYHKEVVAPDWRRFEQELVTLFPETLAWYPQGFDFVRGNGSRDARFPPGHELTETRTSEGWEFELTANPTKNWNLALNASQTESIRDGSATGRFGEVIDYFFEQMKGPAGESNIFWFGGNPLREWMNPFIGEVIKARQLNGSPIPEVREWRANLITNYKFNEGILSGWGFGGGFRYEDSSIYAFDLFMDEEDNIKLDLDKPFEDDSRETVDLWASYTRKILDDRADWKIQLNLHNITGENELVPLSRNPDGTFGLLGKREGFSWTLTNTFTF